MVRILKKFNRKSTRRSRSKAAAIALTTVMALSAAVVFTVPKAEAANGPCDEGDWAYAYIAVGNSETKDNIFSSKDVYKRQSVHRMKNFQRFYILSLSTD